MSYTREIFDTPFRLADTLILASLARAPKHGYVLEAHVANVSLGRLLIGKSSIYKVLNRLLRDGLVVELKGETESRITEYDISKRGRAQLGRDLALIRRVLEAYDERFI